jgi:hypothetical protein
MTGPVRDKQGRFIKEMPEPRDSIIPPATTQATVVTPDHAVDVRPGQLQAALQAEVLESVPINSSHWPIREQKYLKAVAEVIADKGWPTNAMVAAKMGIGELALQRWRHRNPEIDGKVSRALEKQVDELWGRVLHRAFVLAVRGSIDHAVFLAKVTRRLGPETEGPGGVNVQVNIRV